MSTEMYSRIGGKALPKDHLNTVKVINFVDAEGQPVEFDHGSQDPTVTIPKAQHVDPTSGTVADIVTALIAAGLMESA